jgi:hypothetical protein
MAAFPSAKKRLMPSHRTPLLRIAAAIRCAFSHQSLRRWRIEVGKIRCMPHRDHEDVSRIDRLNIHKSGALLITEKKRGRRVAGY